MAGERHGSKAEFKVDDAVAVLTTIPNVSSSSLEQAIDTAETTAYLDTAKKYIPGLPDATLSAEGSYSPTADALLRGIVGLTRDFEYFPGGNVSGQAKHVGQLIITAVSTSSDVGDKVGISASFQVTGGITSSVVA